MSRLVLYTQHKAANYMNNRKSTHDLRTQQQGTIFGCAGCDALSVHLILTVIAGSLSVGISWKAVVGSLGVMIPWQLAHWEEYHTGKSHLIVMHCVTAYWPCNQSSQSLQLADAMSDGS